MAAVFVSTLDNPWDYFTNFDEWYAFDTSMGYNTCAYLARIAKTSSEMSEWEYNKAVEDAIDEILDMNLTGNYIKVYEKPKNGEKNTENEEKEDEKKEKEEAELLEIEENQV